MRWPACSRLESTSAGSVTPLTVLSLALLVSVVALALDGGMLIEERRHTQAVADAAALAAAADLYTNYASNQGTDPKGTASGSALAYAAANGYSNDGVNSVVTVNVSPQNYQGGPNASQQLPPGCAEVIIQSNVGRLFSNLFDSGTIPVRARAVARGRWTPIPQGLILLNLTASGVLNLSSTSSVNVVNASILINSSSATALSLSATSTVTGTQYYLNKNASFGASLLSKLLGSSGGSAPISYIDPIADPLRYLSAPNSVQLGLTLQGTNYKVGSGTVDLYPGIYQGGITVSGGATAILHANANGTPGIYYVQGGGVTVSGPSSIKTATGETAGVMIYNDWTTTSDRITLSGSGNITLIPPASGPYTGLTIFQKPGTKASPAPQVTLSGSGALNITGTLYAAYANINMSGQSAGSVAGGQIVADSLTLTGSAAISIDRQTDPVARLRSIYLIE